MKKLNLSFKKWLGYLISAMTIFTTQGFSTDYSIPITFGVTQTGINRFIAGQWSNAGFTKSWDIDYQGVSCAIQLERPTINLSSNTIKIILNVIVTAEDNSTLNLIYTNQKFTLTPTLTIPVTTISMDKIYSAYTDLLSAIVAVIPDSRVQGAVNQALAPITWVMYEGKILNESTARWTESSDIGWKGLPTLTFAVANDELTLTVTPIIFGNVPSYTFAWRRSSNRGFGVRIQANNYIEIMNLILRIADEDVNANFVSTSTTFDPAIGKYVCYYFVLADESLLNNISQINYFVGVKRQNLETAWHTFCGTALGTSPNWFAMRAVDPLHGE